MMRYISFLMLFSCSLLWAGQQFYPTEYIDAPLLRDGADGITFAEAEVRLAPGKAIGIVHTGIAVSPLEDFTGFALRLSGTLPPGCLIIAETFWSHDGKEWLGPIEDWEIEPNDEEGPRDGYLYSNPYYTARPPARYYRATFHLYGNSGLSPIIENVRFVFMHCGWTEGDVKTVSPAGETDYPMISYVPRGPEGWNCSIPDTFASGTPTYYSYVTHVTIHHTAGATSTPTDPCAQMRNIWNYHVYTRGWCDIGYNFVFDHLGNIYHGRYCADLTTLNVRGAHVSYHNVHTMGFSVMGNFETDTLCHATIPAIYDLISWKCDRYDIDPHGTALNGDPGYEQDAPTILGHKDWTSAATACPGLNFYPMIPMIRDSVGNRIGGGSGGTDTIIVDNGDFEYTTGGAWFDGTYNPSMGWDNDYQYCAAGGELDWANWTPDIPTYGSYDVYIWWYAGANRCNNVFVRIVGDTDDTVFVSQQGSGSQWHLIGRYDFHEGTSGYVSIHDSTATDGGVVVADAVMWILMEELHTNEKNTVPEKSRIDILPNPFNSQCRISVSTDSRGKLDIIAIDGRCIASFPICHGKNDFTWKPYNIGSGIFWAQLQTTRGCIVEKIVFIE